MLTRMNLNFWLLKVFIFLTKECKSSKPNIVVILADDLGMNDVSFRGSNQILTPNIDSLAYNGIILNRFYAQALCTPSRAALLTGKYPIHTGMQHFVIPSDEPWGLPLNFTIMPEIFRDAGYSTNLIGKWHLGFFKREFTPLYRGIDYHYGYYAGYIDYWDHTLIMMNRNYSRGLDMRRNLEIDYQAKGKYATDLFNDEAVRVIKEHNESKPLLLFLHHLAPHAGNDDDPLQAPKEEIEKHDHISDIRRRTYAAMVSKLDEGVGKVIEALKEKNILNNTIVLFYSDNGAPTIGFLANSGSNYPLRGQKNSPWEGGIRTPCLIWSPLIKNRGRIVDQMIHSIDWLPTLASAAGIKLDFSKLKLDGQNHWNTLTSKLPPRNRKLLHNIDEIIGYSSYTDGRWKYVNGTTCQGSCNTWLGKISSEIPRNFNFTDYSNIIFQSKVSQILENASLQSYSLSIEKINDLRENAKIQCSKRKLSNQFDPRYQCNPNSSPCLFDIKNDPCEEFNLAWKYPIIVEVLKRDIENFRKTSVPSVRKQYDPQCNPDFHNYTWTWWQEDFEGYGLDIKK